MAAVPRVLGDGRFTVTRMLGRGGMAEVWECYDHVIEVWRAVKFLNPEFARRTSTLRRFLTEGQALARVAHPNVVRVYDVGTALERPFLLLELANGGSLADYVRKHGRMEPCLAVDCVLHVCSGIQAAHDEGIIHRDIKPDNILVDRRGTCKLTDFGIAQIVEDSSYTRTGSTMGTLAFMPPEQRKDAKNVSARGDVYAIGTTLFALLTGESPAELFMAHHHPHLLADVPPPLRPALLKAIAFEPSERFPTAQAVAEALSEAVMLLDEPTNEVPELVTRTADDPPVPQRFEPGETGFVTDGDQEAVDPTLVDPTIDEEAQDEAPDGHLPYFMPEKAARADTNPSYIDDASEEKELRRQAALEQLERLEKLRMPISTPEQAPEEEPPEPPAPPEVPQPLPEPPIPAEASPVAASVVEPAAEDEPLEPLSRTTVVAVLGGTLALTVLIGLVLVGVPLGLAWSNVSGAASDAGAAQRSLYTAIEEETAIIDDLVAIRADPTEVERELAAFRAAQGAARLDAAASYLTAVRLQVEAHAPQAPAAAESQARSAVHRLDRLTDALAHQRDAHKVWEDASRQGMSPTACSLGLASCAP